MKTKHIPALVMLLGGAVACIVAYINHYSLGDMLAVLSISLMIFLVIGVAIKLIFDSFKLPEEETEKVDDDGEVVEKQGEALEDEYADADDFEGQQQTQMDE